MRDKFKQGNQMETQQEKVSYIIGRQIGTDFKTQGIDVNSDVFVDSFKSALLGEESKISAEETQNIMNTFQAEMQAKAVEHAAKAGGENLKIGADYLEKNKSAEGVTTIESGLQYKVLESGTGNTPTAESTVEVNYEGTLIDGTVFDSSFARGQSATFPVNGVIAGWTEALQLMKEGDVWELTIPAALAYGSQGAGGAIAPHATLLFKVELIKVM
jgi:FKBP-type peptidyl-prolyl cis-trans isomerase FklB